MRRMETRQGYVKFWRLGAVEFGEQSRWGRAPRNKGLWAFPYPFYDTFFTYHKYLDLIPKRFKGEDVSYEEKEAWVNTVGKRILPIREFWYKGDLFAHFTPAGEIEDIASWSTMDATRLVKNIQSSGADKSFWRYEQEGKSKLARVNSSVDHLEVFIAPNMGTIREARPNK